MTDDELQRFESELRRIGPAPVPESLLERLSDVTNLTQTAKRTGPRQVRARADWWFGLRWLMAGVPVALAMLVFILLESRPYMNGPANPTMVTKPEVVRVDHSLVSSFDAVVEVPGGGPVRFRCRKWVDDIKVKDQSGGWVITQSTPRVEVVPVRFETY